MKELGRFVKTTGIYLIGNVLTKAIAFIMLPIYTKYLTPTDYGTFDVNVAYVTFLSSVLFLDIWSAVMRFMFDYQKDDEKRTPILSGFFIFAVSTLLYAVFAFVLGSLFHIEYLVWVFLYGLTINLQQMLAYIVRGFGKNTLFAVSGVIGSLITVLANIVFIAFFRLGYEYLYISSVIGYAINIIILAFGVNFPTIIRETKYNYSLTKEMLVFSLPLTINSVSWWFLTAFNRVWLTHVLSPSANGLYAVANKFSAVVQLIDQAFQMAWQELSFKKGGSNDSDKDTFFGSAIQEYIKFMSLGLAILIPVIRIIFPYFVSSAYSDARNIVPLALIATILSSISTFLGGTLTAIKKNRYLFTTTLSGTVVNVAVIFITIGSLGVQSASVALALGYLVVDVRRYFLLKRYISLHINVRGLFFSTFEVLLSAGIYVLFGSLINGIALLSFLLIFLLSYRQLIVKFISR